MTNQSPAMTTDAYQIYRIRNQYVVRGSRNYRRPKFTAWFAAGVLLGTIAALILFIR